jgi:hypothetical protein
MDAYGNITNTSTGTMAVSTLNLHGNNNLSLKGTVGDFSLITLENNASLTNGNIKTDSFAFSVKDSTSMFSLASGTSLEVTGTDPTSLDYNLGVDPYYGGNYFKTSDGGELIQTMRGIDLLDSDKDVVYRVGNDDSVTVITLQAADGEKMAAGILNSVKIGNTTVTGIQETVDFTIVLDRKTDAGDIIDLHVTVDWKTTDNLFDPSDAERYELINSVWVSQGTVNVDVDTPIPGRSTVSYNQPTNGTYTIANQGANLTVPFTYLNGNVALYEMANPDLSPRYDSFYLDVDNITNFPIGTYPYFAASKYPMASSVGQQVYQQMEYRLITNPLTNLLEGQVPPIGSIVGQAITEGASLTLTADAPVYLEVNGEYTIGKGWLPFGVPASAANIEQYQAPITQGQLDEFYLDFGGREGIFETPASFRTDLDEMIDDLLAG